MFFAESTSAHFRSRRPRVLGLAFASALVCLPLAAHADSINVTYTVRPVSVGQSQPSASSYQYAYTLSGTLSANDTVAINFPGATSASLVDLETGAADFSTFALQPDPAIPADGEFDIVALTSNPDFSSLFTLNFAYSGVGLPGSQAFTLYDSDFNVLQTGTTAPAEVSPSPVPEPASAALLATGALALFALDRRRAGTSLR